MDVETAPRPVDQTIDAICELPRDRLIGELLHFNGSLRLDFTEEFLDHLSDAKLRHILLAAYLQGRPTRTPPTS